MAADQPQAFATLSDDARWQIFSDRDARYDGVFVTAVKTTGIYCRPTCTARKPKRQNVAFFATCEDAVHAGYRPCKRCRPDERDTEVALVEQLCRYMDAHSDDSVTLADLSAQVYLSAPQISRIFKRVLGITPRQYRDARRRDSFASQLKEGENVTQAIYEAGYGSSSRVYSRSPLGMTPGEYQNGAAGLAISYTIVDSTLGRLLVGSTERGVCAVSLADSDAVLEDFLRDEYPAAEHQRDDAGLGTTVQAFLAYLDGDQPHLDLPVDIRVTAFQRTVLDHLRQIPYGETRTYSEVAEAIGKPKAVRAVARACATNPVPLVIPCHRVMGKDGGLRGYRWGMERKAALLDMEQREAADADRQPTA